MGEQTSIIKKTLAILLVVFFVVSLTTASARVVDGGDGPGGDGLSGDGSGGDGSGGDGHSRDGGGCNWKDPGNCDSDDRGR